MLGNQGSEYENRLHVLFALKRRLTITMCVGAVFVEVAAVLLGLALAYEHGASDFAAFLYAYLSAAAFGMLYVVAFSLCVIWRLRTTFTSLFPSRV